ncbi:MAG: murein L,D-transpeptidase catalytic domain family protein [Haliea sp.]|nr:murein L,D-transpeptidase catalytic domain family protein [Haliea sp.]MDP4918420.1 murein L,D-transpeptidase catalytic domain family protein [Haliea sp.]MDP5065456.1 murein L,D-transpeptidase catalytic domain family protein [Haliea sp.]
MASQFSNVSGSYQSSLGLFRASESYHDPLALGKLVARMNGGKLD